MSPTKPAEIRLLLGGLEWPAVDDVRQAAQDLELELAASAAAVPDVPVALQGGCFEAVMLDCRGIGAAPDLLQDLSASPALLLAVCESESPAEALSWARRGALDCVKRGDPFALRLALLRLNRELERSRQEQARRNAEERWRMLVQRSPAGLFRSTLDGRVLDYNPVLARMLGYEGQDAHRLSTLDFYYRPSDRHEIVAKLGAHPTLSNFELLMRRRDGSPIWALASIHLLQDPEHGPVLEGSLVDLSAQKQAELRVRELNRLYAVRSHLNHTIARTSGSERLIQEVCRILVEEGEFRMAWYGAVDAQTGMVRPVAWSGHVAGYLSDIQISVAERPEGRGPTGTALRENRVCVHNDIFRDEAMLPWRERALERGYRSVASFPVRTGDRVCGAFTAYADVADGFDQAHEQLLREIADDVSFAFSSYEGEEIRRRVETEHAAAVAAEQAARTQAKAEARFRELLEAAPDAILEVDRGGAVRLVNAAAERLFGYSRAELLGRPVEFLVPDRLQRAHVGSRTAYLDGSSSGPFEQARDTYARRKDGTLVAVEIRLNPVRTEQGDLVTCIVRDVSARKDAEQALRDSNRQVASILESITDGFFALDGDWRLTYINRKAMQWVSRAREQVLGATVWEAFPQISSSIFGQKLRQAMADRCAVEFTAFYQPQRLWAEVHVYPSESGLAVYIQDITARKHLEEQFRQSQRLESLGRLAGGVAHDFNNLLTIIGGYGQMLLDSVESKNPIHGDLEAIVEAANRASALTRHLLAFSRRQIIQPKVLDLNRLITRMNRMLRPVIGEDIELRLELNADPGRVKADPGHLEQVIMNLVVNARDAMPTGGALTISTGIDVFGPGAGRAGMTAGTYVLLSISDTGSGIDPEIRDQVFEPFFTTKPKGRGTGLGLSTVYGIVKQSGGEIALESELGVGTTFRIWLPQVERNPRAFRSTPRRIPGRGTETILLVEDEPEVRKLAREMLTRLGYQVFEAADGVEALAIWERHAAAIDLVLTDVIMPGMGGRELADALRKRSPAVRVLFMSGYTEDVIAQHGVTRAGLDLVQKPFTREQLGVRVRQALDGSRD